MVEMSRRCEANEKHSVGQYGPEGRSGRFRVHILRYVLYLHNNNYYSILTVEVFDYYTLEIIPVGRYYNPFSQFYLRITRFQYGKVLRIVNSNDSNAGNSSLDGPCAYRGSLTICSWYSLSTLIGGGGMSKLRLHTLTCYVQIRMRTDTSVTNRLNPCRTGDYNIIM